MFDLSVIIVTRNTCALTCAAIESVRASRDDLRKEIFLVDNGSTDDTPAEVAKRFPAVHYLRAEGNLGFAKANNWGVREAAGEFLLLLNSDAAVKADSLATAVGWMRQHPDCGVAGVQLLNPDGSRQNSIANFPTLATELLNKSLLRRLFPSRYPGKERPFTEPVAVESVVGAFMLIRREAWTAIGGLDERYFFFLEETDFCLQARRLRWRVMHLPQITVWHGQGQTAKQVSAAARIEYWRSRYLYFAKNHGPAVRAALAVGLVVRLLVDWLASGVMKLLTFGQNHRWAGKWRVYSALMLWHLRGKPVAMGLKR
jgi:GT2 family glycosyltransferase